METTLKVPIPDSVKTTLELAGYSTEMLTLEVRRLLAAYLFQRRLLTLSQAAELAQLPLREFLPFLASLGVPVLNYPESELGYDEAFVEWQLRPSTK